MVRSVCPIVAISIVIGMSQVRSDTWQMCSVHNVTLLEYFYDVCAIGSSISGAVEAAFTLHTDRWDAEGHPHP